MRTAGENRAHETHTFTARSLLRYRCPPVLFYRTSFSHSHFL